ncbi:MAG: carboxylesterase family protein, partial [Bacteroidota bacterium]
RTGGKPVYRYLYAHPRPPMAGASEDAKTTRTPSMGAGHSWEIEYALGNLKTNKVYAWNEDDEKVSQTMETYFANFIKTGNPNGEGLSVWTPMQAVGSQVMVIDVQSHPEVEQHSDRYQFLSTLY